jgi:hypothetical protein
VTVDQWHAEWAGFKAELEARFSAFKLEVSDIQNKHHAENRTRLQNIDAQVVATGVKMDSLYGSDGQPGVVGTLAAEVKELGNKILYASGAIGATVILVGWYLSTHAKGH